MQAPRPKTVASGIRGQPIVTLAVLLGAVIGSVARAEIGWKPARTWVFAVGILEWKYPDIYESFPDAIPNRADRRLIDALKAAGVPDDHIVFLVDERATLAAVRHEYRAHLERTRKGDLLIFYFAGHGTRDRKTRATYFANYDAGNDHASHWPVKEIFDVLEAHFHGERAILMADCCHSGAMYDEAMARRESLSCACLTSAYSHNISTNNWTFTEALLGGFRGSPLVDADADGTVGIRELALYAERNMAFLEHQKAMFVTTDGFDPGLAIAETRGTPAVGLGRHVEVKWKGAWYPAQVIGIRGEKSLVHYVGFEDSWDEWVVAGRIREPHITDIPRGTRVRVLWAEDEAWYRGTVLASRFGMHKIHYDGYSHEWDDWVPSDSIEQLGE